MADPMEMSLDDIIKTQRQGRGRRGRRGGAGGQQGGQQAAANNKSPFKGGRGRPFRRGAGRGAPAGRPRGAAAAVGGGAGGAAASSGHIIISNLDFQVSDGDLNELFGEFGQIKKARVHFDASGKSQGSADVIFARYQDAMRALQKYNGVPLDGREMRIMIASGPSQMMSPPRTQYSPGRGGRGGQQRSGYSGRSNAATRGSGGGGRGGRFQRRGGRGGNAGGGRGAPAQRSMTKEQLDAEIDAYHSEAQPMDA
ncbi:THO complex subunit 4-like [Sycon ciliatum]|uniref:THO complex subunit 4-like n=1 Tax=Sycon ciliatum TaxID=27933 RepID=UPI0031F66BE5